MKWPIHSVGTALLTLWLAVAGAAGVETTSVAAPFDDGPYMEYGQRHLKARWICNGKVVEQRYRTRQWPVTVAPQCAYPHAIPVQSPPAADHEATLTSVSRIAALSDIHGQYALFVRLLQAHGLIDAAHDWSFGDGHLVIVGDVFDRGAQVNETLWLLYRLEQQAREAGGGVQLLLGNHETMVLYGDLRYIHDRYHRTAALLDTPYPDLYGPHTVLGRWLRSRPVIARINDLLFVHGGIAEAYFELSLPPAEANSRYQASLGLPREILRQDPVLAALYDGKTSPIWYRGYFDDADLSQEQVDAIATRLGVQHIVVGHTSQQHVDTRFGGTVIAVDSSIKNGESGELLLIEDGRMSRGTLDGRRLPLNSP